MTSRRRAFAAVVVLSVAGQACAVAYELTVARRFGTGVSADALALGLTVVLALGNEIVMWVSTLFVPAFVRARARGGLAAARAFFRRCLVAVAVGTGVLAAVLAAGASPLIDLLAPPGPVREQAARLVVLGAPLLVLLPLSVLLAGALQAQGRFALAGLRPLCWYGGALGALLATGAWAGPLVVPAGMVSGLLVFCGLLALVVATALAGSSAGPAPGASLWRLAPALLPLAAASAANYVNLSVERGLAARLPEGSLAALTYAGRLLNLPITLFLLNATTMLLPELSGHAAREETATLSALLLRTVRLALVATVPLAALALALAEPAIAVLLERGAFTGESTRLTAAALAFSAPGIVGIAGVQVLVRAYQALHEIGRLTAIGAAVAALNIALMVVLSHGFGLRGLAAAAGASPIVLFVWMLVGLRHRLPALDVRAVVVSGGRAGVAGVTAAACVWALPAGGALTSLVAGGAVGVAAYAVVLWALSRDDARLALALVAPRWRGLAPGRP